MGFDPSDERCACQQSAWEISATLIRCRACGRLWGRCNGVWRLDPDTCPHTRFQEGDKNRSAVCVDCDAIVRVDVVRGALVRDLVKQRLDGDLVVDRTIVPPKPIEFVKFNFVVPDKEK